MAKQLTNQLGVAFDSKIAEQNEEFLAKVSRSYLHKVDMDLLLELVEHAKSRSTQLNETFNQLRKNYAEQDGLLSKWFYYIYTTNFIKFNVSLVHFSGYKFRQLHIGQ